MTGFYGDKFIISDFLAGNSIINNIATFSLILGYGVEII
jgi:hypothetical protein